MLRAVLLTAIFCGLVAMTSFAGMPPNLERTLAAQLDLASQKPDDAAAHNDLGNLLMLAGRDAEAEAAYRRASEIDPQSTAIRFNLALLMQQSGRPEEAKTLLDELLEIDPYHAWAHYQLGVLYDDQGDRSKAIEHYARAFAYDPALSFAGNNPHVIDNRLSTEALLRAERYRRSSMTRVPRHYSDPQRIADLLLDEEEPEEDLGADEEEQGAEPSKKRNKKRRGSPGLEDGGVPEAPAGGAAQQKSEPTGDQGEAADAEASPRVVGAAAGAGPVGGAVPDRRPAATAPDGREDASGRSPGSRSERQEAMEERFRAFRERMNAGRAPSAGSGTGDDSELEAPTRTRVAPRRQRYRPGSASTGRLELRLLPTEPAERHAARSPDSPAISL